MSNLTDLQRLGQEFDDGFDAGLAAAEAIAVKWRDENRAACAKARKSLNPASRDMADMLDGASIECNAIASEIRKLAKRSTRHCDDCDFSTTEADCIACPHCKGSVG